MAVTSVKASHVWSVGSVELSATTIASSVPPGSHTFVVL